MKFKIKKLKLKLLHITISLLLLLLLIAASVLFLTKPAKADSLIGFNEGSGTTTKDSAGAASGTITNAVWKPASECISGPCLYFDGSGDFVSFGDENTFDFVAATNWTIELWFKTIPISSGTRMLIAKHNATAGGYKIYMSSDGKINFAIDDDSTWTPDDVATSQGRYDDNSWHFISAVKTGTTSIILYIDGNRVGEKDGLTATGTLGNSDTFYVGIDGNGSSNGWSGYIDELKVIIATGKSSDQVKADYQKGSSVRGSSVSFGPNPSSLTNGLAGYWKMDESSWNGTAGEIKDSSGNGYNGTAACTTAGTCTKPTTGFGKFGNGGKFTGDVNSYTSALFTNILNLTPTTPVTLTAWIFPQANLYDDGNSIMTKYNCCTSAGYYFEISPTTHVLTYRLTDGTNNYTLTGSTVFAFNTRWYHVALVFDPTNSANTSFYIDGAREPTAVTGTLSNLGTTTNSNMFQIGARGNDIPFYNPFAGYLDEARYYTRALSASEISQLYYFYQDPVGWWKMDENSGTTIKDATANANNATLSNSSWIAGKYGSGISTSINGSRDYANITDPPSGLLDFSNTDSFTVSSWIKTNSTVSNTIYFIQKGANGGPITAGYNLNVGYAGGSQNAGCGYTDGNGSGQDSVSGFNDKVMDGKWHYITCVIDRTGTVMGAAGIFVFADGVLRGTNTAMTEGSAKASTADLTFGEDRDLVEVPNGGVDDVKIYNYARSQNQIVEDMNGGHPAPGSPVGSAIGIWNFDEGYSTTAHNTGSGHLMDGTLSGATTPTWSNSGKFGKALSFNGTTAYVTIGNVNDNQTANDLTLSAWINLTTNNAVHDIIAKNGASTNYSYRLYTDASGKLCMQVSSNGTATTTVTGKTTLSTSTWYHVTGVYTPGNSLKVYINGILDNYNPTSIPTAMYYLSSANLEIGSENGGGTNRMSGLLDDVRFYNASLTDNQIKLLYNQSSASALGALSTSSTGITPDNSSTRSYCIPGDITTCNPPVAEWKFDENSNTSTYDTSTSNLTTTMNNSPTWIQGKYGSALQFEGSNQSVTATLSSDPAYTNTVELWIYPTTSVASKTLVTASRLTTNASSQPTYGNCVGTAIPLNQWTHLVAVSSANNSCTIYQNGTQSASNTTGVTFGTSVSIGGSAGAYYSGRIDQVLIYNYARTPAQIAWDYNHGDPIARYKFDECTGSTNYNSTLNANGQAAGNNLTMATGGTYTSTGTCNSGVGTQMWNAGSSGKFGSALATTDNGGGAESTEITLSGTNIFSLTDKYSVASWVNFTSLTNITQGFVQHNDSSGPQWGIANGDTGLTSEIECDRVKSAGYHVTTTSGAGLVAGNWYHVVCSFDITTGYLDVYVNGVLKGRTIDTGGTKTDLGGGYLTVGQTGRDLFTNYFSGKVDDVQIYNYALNPTQVKLIYNQNSAVRF